MTNLLSKQALSNALSISDLTDPRQQHHGMQQLLEEIHLALAKKWRCSKQLLRTSPVVPLENNYDRLGYPAEGAARDARYTRYITEKLILRTQTSAAIPDILDGLRIDPPQDLLLILPGLVYRRDSIDRLHCGEPHQLDLWRIVDKKKIPMVTREQLLEMIATVMEVALPDMQWRITHSPHPYTEQGLQIDVLWHDEWVEVGECGIAARKILRQAQLNQHSGLAMGLGLDRLMLLRKNIPDIRLLRSQEPRIRSQMNDLEAYKPVSTLPAIVRDISLCTSETLNEEIIGDTIRSHLPEAECVESLCIKSETAYGDLPPSAHKRMGMLAGQKNLLLQVTLRHMERTLTDEEANTIRNGVYGLLHQGHKQELAMSS
ncbi:hypothetical protein [Motiliproteus sp. MSK22-1]|uniref:PheS-related mystery ligase SrmL n=1 Tax=Motiliproteus sp. MSK22-1 TaxID=1897630 RepID=UPI00097686CE|nr:hypothetical protein [Motiliproteus sp. MSK22-1]OMH27120.1 hypothetical protein BGP75_22640 [Motiliproteus sp. MSK22-1]